MPEEKEASAAPEQQAAPTPTPPATPAPAPTPAPAQAGDVNAPKKTNGCVIAIIVIAVIIVLAGIGIFVAYRFVKNKVTDTIKTDGGSTSINLGDTKGSVSTSGSSYDTATEQNPTSGLVKDVNAEIKPILSKVLGGVKTSAWSSLDADSGSLTYVSKNAVVAADYASIKNGLVSAGYASDSDYSSSDGSMINVTKGAVQVVVFISTTGDDANTITVTISRNAASASE